MLLVTGATGTIGSELARLLVESGTPFRALVRDRARAGSLARDGVDIVEGDFTDPASLDRAFEGATQLFLLAPASEDQRALKRNAVSAARRAGLEYLVHVSAVGAAADAPMQLGRDHAAIEQALIDAGIAHTNLRPQSFMQNLLTQAGAIMHRGEFYSSTGDGRIAMVDARDVARVAARLFAARADHTSPSYDITGPAAVSHAEVAAVLSDVLGRQVRYVDVPQETVREGLAEAGVPTWLADDLVTLNAINRAGHGRHVSSAVSDITGAPARDVAAFARDHRAVFEQAAG
ncbi:MAG: hypothetical protein AMS20_07560 [Gemmatimonas sp. SG8_28]|nr:MAG: hypothetical protein AMS20_07560 [Gemmatimonas sp. SG8_28]